MLLDDGDAELDTEMAVAEEYQAKYIDRKLGFELNQTSNDGTSHASVSKVQGSSRNLRSSGLLHGVVWKFFTDVSGQRFGPVFRGQVSV
jgi:hypothetical protein